MAKSVSKPAAKPTGLTAEMKAKFTALNLDPGANSDTAKETILDFLLQNEVEGVDEYDLKDLVEMAELFDPATSDGEAEATEEEYEEEVAEEDDELEAAEEDEELVEEEVVEDEEEVVDEDYEGLEEAAATLPSKKVVPLKKPAVVAPIKKPTVAATPKVAAKAAPAKVGVGRKPTLKGDKWNGRENEDHLAMLVVFSEIFTEDQYEITTLKQGFTVRVLGKNTNTTVMNYDELRVVTTDEGELTLVGNLYTNRFANEEKLREVLPEQYQDKTIGIFRGESHPCIRDISLDEVLDLLTNSEFLNESLKNAQSTDKRLGENRQKLEQQLNGGKPATTPVKQPVAAVKAAPAKTAPVKGVLPPHLAAAIAAKKAAAAAPAPAVKAPVKAAPAKVAAAPAAPKVAPKLPVAPVKSAPKAPIAPKAPVKK
jgi:hypothetical protein